VISEVREKYSLRIRDSLQQMQLLHAVSQWLEHSGDFEFFNYARLFDDVAGAR